MKFTLQTILRTALLASTLLSALTPAQSATPEEEIITIKFRTFGLALNSMQTSVHHSGIKGKSAGVYTQQFSDSFTYTGPREIVFYGSRALEDDGIDMMQIPLEQEGEDSTAHETVAAPKAPAPALTPAMVVTIPEGMKKALIFVVSAPSGSGALYRGFVVDDSQTRSDSRNVQFYNLTPFSLAVNAFDESVWLAPSKQHRWDVADDKRISSLMIAVNDPEKRVIYSNRFQLRATKRLVFLAHSNGESTADGFPRVTVSHFLKSINATAPNPASLPADDAIENF
jgi:hypothetical protein